MTLSPSPLAPAAFPALGPVAGVRLAAGSAGVRYKNRTDLCVVECAPGTTVAGVYTRSLTASAAVDWCRTAQTGGLVRAIVINSGNANAFTGQHGIASVERITKAAAQHFSCPASQILVASTGVIGEPLPDERIISALPSLVSALDGRAWLDAAKAIMTTDTYPKGVSIAFPIDGCNVTINAIAKGSGMIAPNMATMLCFVLTDAAISAPILQKTLAAGVQRSFNCITVDSDTSTSDSLIAAATGKAGHAPIEDAADKRLRIFQNGLNEALTDLALQVVRDGEGAQKLIAIDVEGAASINAARRIGLAIANSPLVKTAIAGGDANWGRVVMAVGKSGEKADRDKLTIWMGGCLVARNGQRIDGYEEGPVAEHFRGRDVHIKVDVGIGRGKARVWTCDLTHAYIDINADYRS